MFFSGFSPLDEVVTALFVETSALDGEASKFWEELVEAIVGLLTTLPLSGFSPLDGVMTPLFVGLSVLNEEASKFREELVEAIVEGLIASD